MPNINVRKKIESIGKELSKLTEHIANYSGIAPEIARFVDDEMTSISVLAAQVAAMAREVQGDRSAGKVVKDVRRGLGFTY